MSRRQQFAAPPAWLHWYDVSLAWNATKQAETAATRQDLFVRQRVGSTKERSRCGRLFGSRWRLSDLHAANGALAKNNLRLRAFTCVRSLSVL
jgi:hypothetical protein